jgi:two-component system sensor histidine kinase BarA
MIRLSLTIQMFMDCLDESKDSIIKSYQKKDRKALLFHAHKLHGATIYCGVPRMKEAALKLEMALEEKCKQSYIQELYDCLLNETEKLIVEYRKLQ